MNPLRKVLLVSKILGFLLLVPKLWAQEPCKWGVSGLVLDEHNSEPLMLANVFIVELSRGAITDSLGHFEIKGICSGNYTLKISHLGCEPLEQKIRIYQNATKTFYLEHHTHLLEEMAISAKREQDHSINNLARIAGKTLEQQSGKSLGEQLVQESGVFSVKTGNSISKPMIRGLFGSRILILNNSLRLEGQQWGQEHGPEIDPFEAKRIKIIKGASSIRYGHDAMGGVILIEPGQLPITSRLEGKFQLVGESNNRGGAISSFLEGKFKGRLPLSWRLRVTGKKAGNSKTPNYYLKNTGFEELDNSAALGYFSEKLRFDITYNSFQSKLGVFSAMHFGNLTDLKNALSSNVPLETENFSYKIRKPHQQVSHQSIIAKSILRSKDNGELLFNYGWQKNKREEYDKKHGFSNSQNSSLPEQSFELYTNSAEIVWVDKRLKFITLNLGLTGMIQDNHIGGRFFIPAYDHFTTGGFYIQKLEYKKWEIEGSLRFDYKLFRYDYWNKALKKKLVVEKVFNDFAWSGGIKNSPIEGLEIYLNHGRAWRPPSPNELFSAGIHHGAASIELGDSTLKPEKVYFESLGINSSIGKWKFNTEVFLSDFHGFIYLYPTGRVTLTIKGAFPVFEFRQAQAKLYGWEGNLSREILPSLTASGKFSILRGKNVSENSFLINMPGDRVEGKLNYELKNSLKRIRSISLEFSGVYQIKQFRIPDNSDFSSPPGDFALFNFGLFTEIYIWGGSWLISASIENLFNRPYRNYLNRFRYFADDTGRNLALRLSIPFGKPKKMGSFDSRGQ